MLMPTTMPQNSTGPARHLTTRDGEGYPARPDKSFRADNEWSIDFDLSTLARQFSFVIPEALMPNLVANTKEQAIRAMVGGLAEAGAVPDGQQEHVISAILRREQLASTGIGRGVAIPHTKHDGVNRLVAAAAHSRTGIDFESLDGEPVHLIFLLVSPSNSPSDHLRALEAISRHIGDLEYQTWRMDQRHVED